MIIIRNRLLPFPSFAAINIFGVLFCRPDTKVTPRLINHERIHTRQMLEMAILPFYLWYLIEWLVRLPHDGNAYYHISFEREAYLHEHDKHYLEHRRWYAWWRHMKRAPKR